MFRKIIVLFALLTIPLCANASDDKGWYPFIQNKGWYALEGQSGSGSSAVTKEESLVQPTTQPSTGSAQPATNTSSQTGTQQGQQTQPLSSWFK